ncbi:hypothetical protein [Streptomyces avicenniae]|uniref:hypothetical protein n=1 Tax=Streptomyces avicenniae TaxID=500153 RepID=UPI00069A875A|nr:hypothetical protein [Streptomyces avicenniae]
MSPVAFTRELVASTAGVSPWRTQEAFSAEISPEDMADTAVVYRRALGEARVSGDVAETASRLAAEAGTLDDSAMADPWERTAATDRGLGGRGTDMETVADYLNRSMEAAVSAEERVRALVEDRLSPRVQELGETAAREMDASSSPFHGPSVLAKRLAEAVVLAREADAEVGAEIEAYRSTLTRYGQELNEHGYDLAGGPLGLWRSPEMARYAAGELAELLRGEGRPDPADLARWTETLRALARDVLDGSPGKPRDLSAEESRYLMEFYAGLDADALAALGNLGTDGLAPAQGDTQRAALQGVADGVMLLRNLDVMDVGVENGLLFGRAISGSDPFVTPWGGPLFAHEPGTDGFKAALEQYNGFGNVLAQATVPTSDELSERLALNAVAVQERSTEQYEPRDYFLFELSPDTWTENVGGVGLLHAAGLNEASAAEQLGHSDLADRLLRQQWEDSRGAAGYIAQGTRDPGGGLEPDSPQAAARRNVLDAAGRHAEELAGKGPQDKYGHTDHYYLQDTIDGLIQDGDPVAR